MNIRIRTYLSTWNRYICIMMYIIKACSSARAMFSCQVITSSYAIQICSWSWGLVSCELELRLILTTADLVHRDILYCFFSAGEQAQWARWDSSLQALISTAESKREFQWKYGIRIFRLAWKFLVMKIRLYVEISWALYVTLTFLDTPAFVRIFHMILVARDASVFAIFLVGLQIQATGVRNGWTQAMKIIGSECFIFLLRFPGETGESSHGSERFYFVLIFPAVVFLLLENLKLSLRKKSSENKVRLRQTCIERFENSSGFRSLTEIWKLRKPFAGKTNFFLLINWSNYCDVKMQWNIFISIQWFCIFILRTNFFFSKISTEHLVLVCTRI